MIQNLHTHTTFCDGSHTPEEMVQSAIFLGMDSLGFSGHAPFPVPNEWVMRDAEGYYQELSALKATYKDRFPIFIGLEQDYFSPPPAFPCDYLIGSVHFIEKDGEYFCIDERPEKLKKLAVDHFNGDLYALTEAYYDTVSKVFQKTGCQIIGHMDLITKFNEDGSLFDESHPRYQKAAFSALSALLKEDVIFEINTGAISRGYRTTPYPAPFLLKAIHDGGGRICITSDCHHKDTLLTGWDTATALARDCGFTTQWVLTDQGFKEAPLDFNTPK